MTMRETMKEIDIDTARDRESQRARERNRERASKSLISIAKHVLSVDCAVKGHAYIENALALRPNSSTSASGSPIAFA